MIKKIIYNLFFLLALNSLIFSQNKKPFNLSFDCSRFRLDSASKYIELYYAYHQSQFKLVKTDNGFKGGAIITVNLISKKSDSVIFTKKWRAPFAITDTANMSSGKLTLGITGYSVPFGEYILAVKGEDENEPGKVDSAEILIKSEPESLTQPTLSDPQVCSSIKQIPKDDKNIFYKNTLEVVPNPSLLYGVGLPIVYVYLELYGLDKLKSDTYKLNFDVFNVNSQKIKSISKNKKKLYESSVEVGQVNCSDIPSGTYVLRCSIVDDADTNMKVYSFKKLYIYNPHIAPDKSTASASLIADEYGLMNDDDLNREFTIAKYLANQVETEEFSKISSLDAKRNFMSKFWKNRDDDPNTLQNPAKDKFIRAVVHSNTQFRTGQKEGWKTDRGRVWIIYGQPDEIERHPNEVDSKPYEIWYFNNLEGGVVFVFIDKSTMGDYTLVHSTYRNELRDDSWSRLLK